MTTEAIVKKITLLSCASRKTIDKLISNSSVRVFKKGDYLFFDRDEVADVYSIIEGVAALYKLNSAGEKRGIFIYGEGAFLNELILDNKPASINCEALTRVKILCIEKTAFVSICEQDFKLTKAIMDSMALKIRRLYHQIKNTSNSIRLDKRIAARLWKLSRDYGVPRAEGIEINFDLTVTYLAELLGSQRETTSRQLKILTGAGLIIRRKNRFIIPSREKLMDYFHKA
ncbi:transcriptional regulator, Crp/Fnr family [Treponema primitia ZAS-2]|uniref:Transcriptional regulator, Crp/Fnr family n=1 Tax=Treponema primitia (strain ATCC BAA-887 / DSM 12427 / ZAS-2) TaxID=545694 RepID=F5YMW7_TREPZ|nr:Crp/Fnr family transcriptional regulator [Treponema primitia]AEF85339.1 transcriptional regulator, Crp/Fnr family [Treponema primitia ZAS-2]